MATNAFPLTNASVVINTTYIATEQVQSLTVDLGKEQLDITAMGATGRTYTGGLKTANVSVTMLLDYGASSSEAAISAIIGDGDIVLELYPNGTTPAVDNPEYTITGSFLGSAPVISGTVGDLSVVTLNFVGGTWSRATA